MRSDTNYRPSAFGCQRAQLGALARSAEGLLIFRGVLDDAIGEAYLNLLYTLSVDDPDATPSSFLPAYSRLFFLLAQEAELRDAPIVGDAWQNHLLDRLLSAENPFTQKAERAPAAAMGPSLLEAVRSDLRVLRHLFEVDGKALGCLIADGLPEHTNGWVSWDEFRPINRPEASQNGRIAPIKQKLASNPDWPSLIDELAAHFATSGAGDFARYRAFRWVRRDGAGRLEGIAHPDPIRLEQLVEYDLERALLLQNTEQFVAGFPANNVLLYGDRGTGKSSTIKALLHRFGDRGLRLIEVPKALLEDYPSILAVLRGRREKFILFVDDLSFDQQETAYKALKAALEGSVEARPDNVVVYATSNRRHLVQERFSDRRDGDDEIRSWDTHQEKLSLADRFGLTLIFSTPDQGRFLRIVEKLARGRNLDVDDATLRSRALQWAALQGGFSGRTARQFVDHLTGELGLAHSK
jgi:predicted AAA+ superfamily ATPase